MILNLQNFQKLYFVQFDNTVKIFCPQSVCSKKDNFLSLKLTTQQYPQLYDLSQSLNILCQTYNVITIIMKEE